MSKKTCLIALKTKSSDWLRVNIWWTLHQQELGTWPPSDCSAPPFRSRRPMSDIWYLLLYTTWDMFTFIFLHICNNCAHRHMPWTHLPKIKKASCLYSAKSVDCSGNVNILTRNIYHTPKQSVTTWRPKRIVSFLPSNSALKGYICDQKSWYLSGFW